MSFAAFAPRTRWLDGHLVLARRINSPRFSAIDTLSPRNVVHAFRLTSPGDADEEFSAWLAEAYQVGEQFHLRVPRVPASLPGPAGGPAAQRCARPTPQPGAPRYGVGCADRFVRSVHVRAVVRTAVTGPAGLDPLDPLPMLGHLW